MFCEAVENGDHPGAESGSVHDWRTIDRALRSIAKRRGELDAEEARWLREAEAQQIWRPLGMVSALDYLERQLGYGPRAAHDRLRVARALGALPELTAALDSGELAYSAIRELTRVATPGTEAAWRARAAGKNLRQIEQLVAGHKPGDDPDDPPEPEVRPHAVRFELSADTYALLRQARGAVNDAQGRYVDDDELVAALCSAVLDGARAATAEPTGRARFQIAMTVCERCKQGWQHGGGALIPVSAAAVERAECDSERIGSLDDAMPARLARDIPPSVVRFVWHRDHGCCRVPGCRSSLGLDLHHLVHRADGGSHDASNVILACGSCHRSHHEGRLTISGTAEQLEITRAGEQSAHVGTAHGTSTAQSPCRQDACAAGSAASAPASAPHARAVAERKTSARSLAPCRQDAGAGGFETSAPASAPHTSAGVEHQPSARSHAPYRQDACAAGSAASAPASAPHASTVAERKTSARSHAPCRQDACAGGFEARSSTVVECQPGVHVGTASMVPEVAERACVETRARRARAPGADVAAHSGACAVATAGGLAGAASGPVSGPGETSRLDQAVVHVEVKQALVQLGWKPPIAQRAVAAATAALGADAPLEQLVREALRRCPRPSA